MSADAEQSVLDCVFGDGLCSCNASDEEDVDAGDTDTALAPPAAFD